MKPTLADAPSAIDRTWTRILPSALRSRIEGRENLQKILANTGWLFADRVIRMGVGLLVSIWVARYLGPEQFGVYNYAIAFVALFGTLATLGLDSIVVRDLVRDPSRRAETLGTTFALKLIGGMITLAIILGAVSLTSPSDSLTRWLVATIALSLIFQSFDAIDFWFQSQIQSKYTVSAKNSAFIVLALVKLLLIWQQAPLLAFAGAYSAEAFLGAVGLVITYRINRQAFRAWRTSVSRAKELLKDSWPLILAGVAIMVYMRIGIVMLKGTVGDRAVGIYSAATRISEIWYFIPVAIASSISPSIIEAKMISGQVYDQRLQRAFNVAARLAYLVVVPMTFLSSQVVVSLFGSEYAGAGPVLAVHVWTGLFVFLGVIRGIWMVAEGYMLVAMISTLCGAGANILLNLFLLPSYAEMGAAISTVISYSFADYFIFLIYPRFRKIGWMMTNALTLGVLEKRVQL